MFADIDFSKFSDFWPIWHRDRTNLKENENLAKSISYFVWTFEDIRQRTFWDIGRDSKSAFMAVEIKVIDQGQRYFYQQRGL